MVKCSAQIPAIALPVSRFAENAGAGLKIAPPDPCITRHGGSKCSGKLIDLHLAHELITDILQLRFNQCSPPAPS